MMMAATVSASLARSPAFIQRVALPSGASGAWHTRRAKWSGARRSTNDNLVRLRSTEPSAEDDYSSLTVSQLRAALKERNLPVSGIKATLIDRLSRSAARETSSLPPNLVFSSAERVDGGSDPNQTVGTPSLDEEPVSERKTFKEDFLGTRVFVQGLSERTTWKELKDHFQIAGSVVFASVSIDRQTGRSKQHGIVQFETPEEAKEAIKVMRSHPLDGEKLYVREDVQESRKGSRVMNVENRYDNEVPNEWKRANDEQADGSGEDWYNLKDDELKEIEGLIRKRDAQRRQRNYKMSDKIREQLKLDFGVHLDDRLKMWWTETQDGGVPDAISDIKGEGRWGKRQPWRQIPTPSDDKVDTEHVMKLLAKRDRARKIKDFDTADEMLELAHKAPEGDLGLRIHDESRTWRIWTEKPPSRHHEGSGDQGPAEMCLNLVKEHEPEKIAEVQSLLSKFQGREWNIYKRLRERYVGGSGR